MTGLYVHPPEVDLVNAPAGAVRVANERAALLLAGWRWQQSNDLALLARSCYLQGVEDAAAVFRHTQPSSTEKE